MIQKKYVYAYLKYRYVIGIYHKFSPLLTYSTCIIISGTLTISVNGPFHVHSRLIKHYMVSLFVFSIQKVFWADDFAHRTNLLKKVIQRCENQQIGNIRWELSHRASKGREKVHGAVDKWIRRGKKSMFYSFFPFCSLL